MQMISYYRLLKKLGMKDKVNKRIARILSVLQEKKPQDLRGLEAEELEPPAPTTRQQRRSPQQQERLGRSRLGHSRLR